MTSIRRAAVAAFALAAAMSAAGSVAAKEWKEIRFASEGAYPPFNFTDSNNQLQGFDIDIGKAICEKAKVKCTFVTQDWDGMIPALIAGKYDAIIASMSITDERKQKVDFTDKYYQTPASVAVPKDSKIKSLDPAAFKGTTVGAQSATTHATFAEDVYAKAGANVKLYATQDEAALDLVAGRLDAVFADKIILAEWLKKDGAKCCKSLGDVDTKKFVKLFGEGAGIAIRKDEKDLRELLNKAIAATRADGTYQKVQAKYFDFDIY